MRAAEKSLRFYQHLKLVHDFESRRYTKAKLESKIDQAINTLKVCQHWINDSRKGKVPVWVEELRDSIVNLKFQIDSLDKPFRLFVIGTGKAGKSSVLNALIGQKVAEIDFVAKTWRIDVFYESHDSKVVIKYADGTSKIFEEEEAKSIIDEEEGKAKFAIKQVNRELLKLRRNKNLIGKARREAEISIQRHYGYQTNIIEVQWPVIGSSILQNFSLVDTPGTNQKLTHRNVRNSEEEYLKKANGILWIIPEDMIAGGKSYKAVVSMEKRYGRKFESAIAIINKMDLAREKDPIHGEEYIMQEASRLYGKHFRKILPFEAEKAYESVCKNDEKGMKDSGLTVLRQAIREEFFLTAREKQLDDIHDSIQDVKLSISDKINSIIQDLCDANKLYEDKRREWEDAIQSSEQDSIKKMQAIFDRTLQRIRRNATRYEDKIDSLEGEDRTKFINDEVLEYDILARDLENFRAALEADISLLLRIYKDKMRFIEYENLFSLLQNQGDGYDNINIVTELGIDEDLFSTFGEKFFLSGVLGISAVVLLGPIGLAAAFLGPTSVGHTIIRWFQKVTGNGIVDKIVKSYQNKFNEKQVKLEESIHKNYQEACKRLMDLEDTTFAQVYVPISELSDLKNSLNKFNQIVSDIEIEEIPLVNVIRGGAEI
jgi:GTPase Era involved in 16S rRNA processing